ncbi:NAD+ synthase [soil metagenome]
MRIGLAQFNPTIGALAANAAGMLARIAEAHTRAVDLLLFPELALTGYPPRDLLQHGGFMEAVEAAAAALARAAPRELTVIFGLPMFIDPARRDPQRLHNALCACRAGKVVATYAKRLLPTYDVFDEDRYFEPGAAPVIIDVPIRAGSHASLPLSAPSADPAQPPSSCRVGLSICEDLWRGEDVGFAARYLASPDPIRELVAPPDGAAPAQLVVNPSASPFRLATGARHRELLRHQAATHGVFVAAVNQVGANDELIFDGAAQIFAPDGSMLTAGKNFAEDLVIFDIDPTRAHPGLPARARSALATPSAEPHAKLDDSAPESLLFHALTLGIRDYCRKTGFARCVLGVSGGIDSAVVAVLAAAALGPASVTALSLPSRYSSEGSRSDAADLCAALGVAMHTLPIQAPHAALESTLAPLFAGRAPDVTEENVQSRIRGTLLMAFSNKFGALLLTTGNKSELAVGYCTLYGDMNGGLAVISDVSKTLVYRLARWMNAHWRTLSIGALAGPPIPAATIDKPPSAELRPDQRDQDSLPPYDLLDEIIERGVEQRESPAAIVAALSGRLAESEVRRVLRLIELSEFKRRQAAPGLKVTSVAFGTGRRMPIAQGWKAGVGVL